MNAFEMKARISHFFLGLLLRKRVQIPELAKELKISQAKILELVNPSVTTLDLVVFTALCAHFNVRIRMNGGPNA